MTPSMNMGMKGPQQTGLASIAQPATQPRGKSPDSIGEIMALAKKLSDGELSDILAGKSMAVPQYVAMTEAMGRRSLRNAVKGAQAMAQAKQPSIKDKFLMAETAEMMPEMPQMAPPQMMADGGLAMLPAPNMDTVDMAGGGIIAFSGEDESLVKEPVFGSPEYNEKYGEPGSLKRKFKSIRDYYASPSSTGDFGRNVRNTINAAAPIAGGVGVGGNIIPKTGGIITNVADKARQLLGLEGAFNAVTSGGTTSAGPVIPAGDGRDETPAAPPAAPPASPNANKDDKGPGKGGLTDLGMPSYDDLLKRRTTDYLSKYEGLEDKKRARVADVEKGLQSQVLLDASAALLGSRNLAEAGGKFGTKTSSTLAAARAEKNQLEDAADQYGFNIAKAREAAEKGDMQLAMQYAQLANQNKYQMGMLDVYNKRNAIMGEAGQLGKVSLALNQAEKQALAEAKQKYPVITKTNQAAYDMFIKKRARELKMGNPLTKQYADLSGGDLGGGGFNMVQSLPKGASAFDPSEG